MTTGCQRTSVNVILRALADEQRRHVIECLRSAAEGVASPNEIATYVCDQHPKSRDPMKVSSRLHHSSFPALDEADLIEYDADRGVVRYREVQLAEEILDCIEGERQHM